MKTVRNLKLSQLCENEMGKREMNKLVGGANCCICGCNTDGSHQDTLTNGTANYNGDKYSPGGGYGSGEFA